MFFNKNYSAFRESKIGEKLFCKKSILSSFMTFFRESSFADPNSISPDTIPHMVKIVGMILRSELNSPSFIQISKNS